MRLLPGGSGRSEGGLEAFFAAHKETRKARGRAGFIKGLAEREGFEPSIEFLTLYSLSRGAPSATRPSLQSRKDNRLSLLS